MSKSRGGVEKRIALLSNYFTSTGVECHIISLEMPGELFLPYELTATIKWHAVQIGAPKKRASLQVVAKRAAKLRELILNINPDIAIAFDSGVFFSNWLYLLGLKLPLVAAETNSPDRFRYVTNSKASRVFLMLRPATRIFVQFEEYKKLYPWFLQKKIVAIPNPVQLTPLNSSTKRNSKVLLSIGRLTKQKGFADLIHAFALVHEIEPAYELHIYGEGEDQCSLSNLVENLQLTGWVKFFGSVNNIDAVFQRAEILVLASLYEGFPNALAEAMSHSLPCVAFDSCLGAKLLLGAENPGLVVPLKNESRADALARKIMEVIASENLKSQLGESNAQRANNFSIDKVGQQYLNEFNSILSTV